MPGEGSVFRRASDGKWLAQLSLGGRGSRKFLSKTLGTRRPSREDVAAAFDELRSRAESGVVDTTTTGAYLEQWVRDVRNIRPTTRATYRAAIVTHIAPAIGHIPLASLTPGDVERMLGRWEATVGRTTARHAHAVLRRALGQAVKQQRIRVNVASREFVDAPRVVPTDPQAFTDAEVAALLEAAEGDRIGPLVTLALETGLRQGELLGLAWEDIGERTLTVRKELVYRDGTYHREEPKTERSKRTVPLSELARGAIDAQRARLVADGFVPVLTGPVFTNHRGGALSGSWVTHRLYDLEAKAGIRRLAFRNLRTTFSSRLIDRGEPEIVVSTLLGHARSTTTRKHYIAVTPERLAAAVGRKAG